MARSAGSARSNEPFAPAASIIPPASRHIFGVMKTGACTNATPPASRRFARAVVPAGDVVEWSTTRVERRPSPAAPRTASTTASSVSITCTRSAPATASGTVVATRTPKASRALALATDRFQAVTRSPRFAAASASAPPMSPAPRKVIEVGMVLGSLVHHELDPRERVCARYRDPRGASGTFGRASERGEPPSRQAAKKKKRLTGEHPILSSLGALAALLSLFQPRSDLSDALHV